MNLRYVILGTALLLPVTLLSCDDSGSEAPTEATDEAAIDNPSFGQSSAGQAIRCFQGTGDGFESNGVCQMLSNIKNGANVSTFDGDENPNNNYAGIYPKKSAIKGKLLPRVNELEFHYAGGPPTGGAPRLSIPIDECRVENGYVGTVYPPPCQTDGVFTHDPFNPTSEQYAFIDANGCNKSKENDSEDPNDPYVDNAFVGEVDPGDDDTCTVNWKAETHPNWESFVAAHQFDRIAKDVETFVIIDQPGHYLLYGLQFR